MTSTEDSPSDGNRTEPDVGAPSSAAAVRPPEREGRRIRLLTLVGSLLICIVGLQIGRNAPAEAEHEAAGVSAVRASATSTPSPSSSTPAAVPSKETEFPDTPAGRLDKKAHESGWVVDSEEYASASGYTNDVCQTFKGGTVELGDRWVTPGQHLAEGAGLTKDEEKVLRSGVPQLCPRWWPQVLRTMNDTYERFIGDGTYDVAPKGGFEVMPPGAYRSEGGPLGDIMDCYWERTTGSGDIIDNNFVTVARSITVTVRAGELFTSENCGVWKPVK
ncbi:hypothetical protein [Streptomyces brevispora]|uniref:PASTA domain-containing protein n=1 Tax=Streptomyces brevispora TaxID=887462 RepID=A0ABZ1G5Q9_9ACTN|nr:hypothetical protein [Streptomyces brevispora]WSC15220.1 hypothetical protein OIE64_21890 [Streptomyces brevispora]